MPIEKNKGYNERALQNTLCFNIYSSPMSCYYNGMRLRGQQGRKVETAGA